MSKTLTRLRKLFDDPLLVRTTDGMQLTLFAKDLEEQIDDVLCRIDTIAGEKRFEPSRAKGIIRIAMTESCAIYLVPELSRTFKEAGTQLRLHSETVNHTYLEDIASNRLDYGIFVDEKNTSQLEKALLAEIEPILLMRKNHPLTGQLSISPDDFLNQQQIINNTANFYLGSLCAKEITTVPDEDKLVLDTSQLSVALEMILSSDMIMITSPFVMMAETTKIHFTTMPIPQDLIKQKVHLWLYFHHRNIGSPLHDWIIAMIRDRIDAALGKASNS